MESTALDLLWGARPQPRRGPKPALTLEGIAAAAIAVADAEGLAAISMQRVAGELGYTKMSLYRYLPGKAELVAVMTDQALGAPPAPPEPAEAPDWAARLTHWAEHLRERFAAHPWALETTAGPRPVGPNELGWLERALTPLAGTGLTAAERTDAVTVLTGHVRTIAQQQAAAPAADSVEEQLAEGMARVLAEHGDRYPEAVAALAGTAPAERDQAWTFGLRCILAGLAELIASRQ